MEFFAPYPKEHPDFKTGILTYKDEEFHIGDTKVENNRAIHGDEVFFHLGKVNGIKKRFQGFISGILHLNSNQKFGFTKKNVPYFKFTPLSGKYPTFIVPSKCREKVAKYCVIKINKWEPNNKKPIGQIEYLLGNVGNPEAETEVLLFKNDIFPKKSKIEYFEQVQPPKGCYHYSTFSIDPKGCRDIDDSLHFYQIETGVYEVGIHIANVAAFLEDIDTNFFSSVYLKDRIITMLDEEHSFNQCSLGNAEHSKSLSLILRYNNNNLISHEFKETIVKNTALSYQDAEQMIQEENRTGVYNLWDFTRNFMGVEELSATKMVEHYMILYNNMVAKFLYENDRNTILRTHKSTLDFKSSDDVLENYLLKRQLNSAVYESNPENTRHDSLDLDLYTHATSPIRRYVDIINQINIIRIGNKETSLVCGCLEKINLFQKNLRKFYNNYKKLDVIFGPELNVDAYIVNIEGIKISVFIPELDFEHSFNGISRKLIECNQVEMGEGFLEINGERYNKYDKLRIKITPLPFEERFNKKIHISIVEQ